MTEEQWVRQGERLRAAEIGERLKLARERAFGPRGRSKLARALGLSGSTYNYYEGKRVAPPDVLARAAELTGVRLEWLISGDGPRERTAAQVAGAAAVAGLDPQLQVVLERLAESGGSGALAQGLAELLDVVQQRFPSQVPVEIEARTVEQSEDMVPVVGRTAAGLVGDYAQLLGDEPATTVAEVVARAVGQPALGRRALDVEADDPRAVTELPPLNEVSLVQLEEPLESGVVEFVDITGFRRRWRGAFAMRVDGDSMRPRFRHGDVVVAVAGQPVGAGQAALVQIRGRIGVTLKLVRRDGETVHLVPINETYDTESVPAAEIEWMSPVLFGIRF